MRKQAFIRKKHFNTLNMEFSVMNSHEIVFRTLNPPRDRGWGRGEFETGYLREHPLTRLWNPVAIFKWVMQCVNEYMAIYKPPYMFIKPTSSRLYKLYVRMMKRQRDSGYKFYFDEALRTITIIRNASKSAA